MVHCGCKVFSFNSFFSFFKPCFYLLLIHFSLKLINQSYFENISIDVDSRIENAAKLDKWKTLKK